MREKSFIGMLMLVLVLMFSVSYAGTIVFQDNFNSENGGIGVMNWDTFSKWDVTQGTVDLQGGGLNDVQPWGFGLYVDLDGSTNEPGTIRTKRRIRLDPGVYDLSFYIGSNWYPDNSINIARIRIKGVYRRLIVRFGGGELTKFTKRITLTNSVSSYLSFQSLSKGDSGGIFIDNVKIEKIR